ncbi:MAG TPA: NUDIX hydrolase [Planctomycetota bacterium]|nr:NUDIX hydrolase [Planctomycetota bacterium]
MPEAVFVSAEPLFRSDRFDLMRETFATSDGPVVRPVIHHPGAVALLAQPDAQSLVLVRQYRYPIRRWTLEIPAGTRVIGEAPEVTAARELREEAGYTAARITEVTRFFPAVNVSDEEMILYHAEGLSDVPAAPEHGELVAREIVAFARLQALMASGELCDAKTLIALAMLGLRLPGSYP